MSYGDCEISDCGESGVIFLNGQRLLCWEHYKEAMGAPNIVEITAGGERLRQIYADAISIVNSKRRAKHPDDEEND